MNDRQTKPLTPAQQAAVRTYVASVKLATIRLNQAITHIDWNITDAKTAQAECDKLIGARSKAVIDCIDGRGVKALKAAALHTWDSRLIHQTEQSVYAQAWHDAVDAETQARHKIRAIARERTKAAGAAELAALGADAEPIDVARATIRKTDGRTISDMSLCSFLEAIDERNAETLWCSLIFDDNKGLIKAFSHVTGVRLASTQRRRRAQLWAWANRTNP